MAVVISLKSTNPAGYLADYNLSGLDTTKAYDVVRIIEGDGTNTNERKYQTVAHRRNWKPAATAGVIRDYEAPLRPYSVAIYDSALQTPLDWLFEYGPYTGPAPLSQTATIQLTPPDCGALLRSTFQLALFAEVSIRSTDITYPVRSAEHAVIASRFPVFINDRRQGRTISDLVLWAPTLTDSKRLTDILIPDTGRVHPLYLRTSDADLLMFHDLYFMPGEIYVEPVSFAQPYSKWFHIEAVELDGREGIAPRAGDGSLTVPPVAVIGVSPSTSGKVPYTVTFTDSSTGTISSRRWTIYDSRATYKTSTAATFAYKFAKTGTFVVKLTVSGSAGADVSQVKIVVVK